ncbi:MAG: polyamine ABC transporter substrate-binding protein [Succinivibrio sp.]|nr:polyamine ABC transporter substrate-binding protein [Succinivibrio sp.]
MKSLNKLGVTAALTLCCGVALSAQSDVNIWNWSDYIGENTVKEFTQATGLKNTNYVLFDSNELVEARLLSGHSGFDAVMMVSYYVPRLAKAGALQKIDKSKLPNYGNLSPARMEALAAIDPNNEYAYPYTEISIGIGYNTKKIAEIFGPDYKVDSWDMLFKKENSDKLKKCGIAILDSPIEIISAVMHYLHKDPLSENPADYKEAQRILTALASNTAYLHSARYINDLASGDICVAIGYSGDILQSRERAKAAGKGIDIEYVIPQEGSLMWFDCWTVPAGAEHYDNAMTWFNYLMDPEISTPLANEIRYPMPITKTLEDMDPDLAGNPSIVLSDEMIKKMYFVKPITSKVSHITNKVWNAMKLDSTKVEDGAGWD